MIIGFLMIMRADDDRPRTTGPARGRGAARVLPQPGVLRPVRRHGIALVVADNPGRWPVIEEITTDLMYVRLHGHDELYASGYSDRAARRLGRQDQRLGVRRAGCLRLLRQRRQGAGAVRRHGSALPGEPLTPVVSGPARRPDCN